MEMQSEQVNELFSALSKMQSELPSAKKDSNNPFFKSKYADLVAVFEACREPLAKYNLCVSQLVHTINDQKVLVTILGHASGQWIKSISPIIVGKQDIQGFGAGITYIRRYALVSLLGIIQDDDDGRGALSDSEKYQSDMEFQKKPPNPNLPSIDDVKLLERILKDCPSNVEESLRKKMTKNGWENFGQIPKHTFIETIEYVKSKATKEPF
jgi:hypothetical protein